MEYKSLVDVAKSILDENENLEFATLFEGVKEQLFSRWRDETPEEISDQKMLENKRGELYRLLTIDGRFFYNNNGTWTSLRREERN
ncbi:DNA-directed RNA polymerase subunit delta [Mycoplasma struthionis]|uniref:Uncharacterized protein n=1 Tax=Mycoplasma struthionis TaxID=538220 RepID=A0A3G8LG25_9MOLU|nr:hypothetical protein [Mycoplasma struthionis]AZG68586.1 hypothetical protein EGN60_01200 [Mycoplasma struthionis]